jgi:fatty-acyl-CoA synthase
MIPSFVHGLDPAPLRYETIGQAFDTSAAAWGTRDALIVRHQNVRWTYAELKQRVDRLAAGLLALGLKPGDRIGIWAPNCSEWTLTQFASAKAGLILVNMNPAYRLSELEFSLNKVGCRALVLAERFKNSEFLGVLRALAPELDTCAPNALRATRLPHLQSVIRLSPHDTPGCLNFDAVMQLGRPEDHARLEALSNELQPDDAVNIQFTSGTTGLPKGATLSHFNILNNGYFVARALRLHERDRMCIPVPLYHCFGMVMGNLGCVTHGAAMVYPAEWFDPGLTLEAVATERCSVLYGVPTMFIAELEHPEFSRYDLTSLRTGIMAGAPCPIEVMKRVIRDMHMQQVTIAYGMTETSPVSFQSSTDDSIERRVSTVGRIHPHLQVKVVDPQGRVVARGSQGELLTRGYSVMKGYWQDPERTREAIDEAGWMLLQHHGPAERLAHPRRREHFSPRDRGVPVSPSEGAGRAGVRGAGQEIRRGSVCLDAVEAGDDGDRGRHTRVLPRADRTPQDSALRALRERVSNDRHRQGAEVRHARADVPGPRVERRSDRLRVILRARPLEQLTPSGVTLPVTPVRTMRKPHFAFVAREPRVESRGPNCESRRRTRYRDVRISRATT